MAKRRGFFRRIRNAIDRLNRATTRTTRTSSGGGGGGGAFDQESQPIEIEVPEEYQDAEELSYPADYGTDVDVEVSRVDEETTVVDRIHIPGPDPMKLRSGDILATALVYGISGDEYEALAEAIDIAYNNPASTYWERRQALNDIREAMDRLHAMSVQDFDWAAWREAVYGGAK